MAGFQRGAPLPTGIGDNRATTKLGVGNTDGTEISGVVTNADQIRAEIMYPDRNEMTLMKLL